MPPILLEPQREKELRTRGYTVVRLLDPGEPPRLLEALTDALPHGFTPVEQPGKQFEFHASFLDSNLDYRRRSHERIRELFQPRLDEILVDYEILIAGLFVKQPGTGAVPLHFDWSMIEAPDDIGLNVWCPLVDVDAGNGALHLVEGSQRLLRHIGAPHTPIYCSGYDAVVMERSTMVPLEAGEALIYDNTILHWSPVNRSSQPRPVIAMNCIPRRARPVFYRLDSAAAGSRFEVFDMSDGGFFEHLPGDFFTGAINRPSLGYIDSPNQRLSADDFVSRLDARRSGAPPAPQPGPGPAATVTHMFGSVVSRQATRGAVSPRRCRD
jgi:hypothetical protein